MKLLSTQDAARALGLQVRAVQLLIANGTLPAQRVGRTFVIREQDLAKARKRRGPGWEKGRKRKSRPTDSPVT